MSMNLNFGAKACCVYGFKNSDTPVNLKTEPNPMPIMPDPTSFKKSLLEILTPLTYNKLSLAYKNTFRKCSCKMSRRRKASLITFNIRGPRIIKGVYERILHLSHAYIILIVAVAANVTSISFVAFALTGSNSSNHQQHLATNRQLIDLERHASIIREGDAKILPDFRINRDFVDSDDSCDFCTQVNYTPSIKGQGAITLSS